jgi:hypothetical protein
MKRSREYSFYYYYLFILNANWFLPGGSGTTIRQHTNNTNHTKQHTTLKQNTAHKTTQTIKDTLHTMNAMQIQLQLQLNILILIKNKYTIH